MKERKHVEKYAKELRKEYKEIDEWIKIIEMQRDIGKEG